eukprot:6164591-Amphidinium_carterae.1
MFYYGRWEALLGLVPEEEAHRAILEDVADPPPGLVKKKIKFHRDIKSWLRLVKKMCHMYVDLFYEGDGDDDTVDLNVQEVQEVQKGDE